MALSHEKFDVVLMDLEMPDMSGLEVAQRHRSRELERHLRRTPLIALTGHAADEFSGPALAAGFDAFLTKPFRITDLLSTLQAYCK